MQGRTISNGLSAAEVLSTSILTIRFGITIRDFIWWCPGLSDVGAKEDRRVFIIHVLVTDADGFYDLASSRTRMIRCSEVHSDGRAVTCYVDNPDGSLLKATFPAELVTEIDELVPAKVVRAVRRKLRQAEDEVEHHSSKKHVHDPAYR